MAKRVVLYLVLYLVWIPIWLWAAVQIGRLVDHRDNSGVTVLLAIVGLGVPGALGPYLLQRAPGWQKSVLANGRSAPAVIRQLKNTRWGDRHNPFYQFNLEVQPPGEAPFVVTFEQSTDWKGRNWEYRKPGESVIIKYDPQNKRHVVVTETVPPHGPSGHAGALAHPLGHVRQPHQMHPSDPDQQPGQAQQPDPDHQPSPEFPLTVARPPAPAADLAGELERLAKLRDGGQLTDAEYVAAKHKLLG